MFYTSGSQFSTAHFFLSLPYLTGQVQFMHVFGNELMIQTRYLNMGTTQNVQFRWKQIKWSVSLLRLSASQKFLLCKDLNNLTCHLTEICFSNVSLMKKNLIISCVSPYLYLLLLKCFSYEIEPHNLTCVSLLRSSAFQIILLCKRPS